MWSRAVAASGLLTALAVAALPIVARAADEEGCYGCHALPGFAVREGAAVRGLAISPERYEASAHGDLGCRECHLDVAAIPHGDAVGEAGCGGPCHGRTAGGREYSHEGLYWEYAASVHGSQREGRIGCLVCHPAPAVRERGRDKLDEVRRCAACHRGNARVRAWFDDRHFLALAAGDAAAPSCPDCHTAHRVRPPRAAESTVSPGRLAATCSGGALEPEGRGCHGGLVPAAVAGASMTPLPRAGGGVGGAVLSLCAGVMILGLAARAGLGLLRGR